MLADINSLRKSSQKSELGYDYNLEKAAMQRAAEIAIRFDSSSHLRPDGAGYLNTVAEYGFNVSPRGYFYSELITFNDKGMTKDEAFSTFSPRMNTYLLSDFYSAGISHITIDTTDFWVVILGDAPNNSSAVSAVDGERFVSLNVPLSLLYDVEAVNVSGNSVSLTVGGEANMPQFIAKAKVANSVMDKICVAEVNSFDGLLKFESADEYVKAENGKLYGLKSGTGYISTTVLGYTVTVPIVVS